LYFLRRHFHSAVFCDNPPPFDAATCSSDAAQAPSDDETALYPYNTVIEYNCIDGRKFYDGQQSKSVICNSNGLWSETDLSCSCEHCKLSQNYRKAAAFEQVFQICFRRIDLSLHFCNAHFNLHVLSPHKHT
jgi:hypothetical protein